MTTIHINKAQPTGDEIIPDTLIEITTQIPDLPFPEYPTHYEQQAQALHDALKALPGGTYDQLLVLMLTNKASLFRVPHFDFE